MHAMIIPDRLAEVTKLHSGAHNPPRPGQSGADMCAMEAAADLVIRMCEATDDTSSTETAS